MSFQKEIWLDKLQELGATVVQQQGIEKGTIKYISPPTVSTVLGGRNFKVLVLGYIHIGFGSAGSDAYLFCEENNRLYRTFYGGQKFAGLIEFDDNFLYFVIENKSELRKTYDPENYYNYDKEVKLDKPKSTFTRNIFPWYAITSVSFKNCIIDM